MTSVPLSSSFVLSSLCSPAYVGFSVAMGVIGGTDGYIQSTSYTVDHTSGIFLTAANLTSPPSPKTRRTSSLTHRWISIQWQEEENDGGGWRGKYGISHTLFSKLDILS